MRRAVAAMVVVVVAIGPLRAQEQDPWARLTALPVGTPLVVMTMSGVVLEGGLTSIGEEQVVVATSRGDQRQVARADIKMVRATRGDSILNGVLAGAALGLGGGAGLAAAWYHGSGRYGAKPPGYQRDFITGAAVLGAVLGALIGWRVDKSRARSEVIYGAPPTAPQ